MSVILETPLYLKGFSHKIGLGILKYYFDNLLHWH